jgi:hypothetical protein
MLAKMHLPHKFHKLCLETFPCHKLCLETFSCHKLCLETFPCHKLCLGIFPCHKLYDFLALTLTAVSLNVLMNK